MFTGIIQGLATVRRADTTPAAAGATPAHRLELELGPLADGLVPGASVAVNGVCLTAAAITPPRVSFDVIPETWQRSALSHLKVGDQVHIENSLRVGDPLDGHFVQGHVDGVGHVDQIDRSGEWKLWVQAGDDLLHYIVPKGSIALDGTSLTVVDVQTRRFSVALVPTTLERTTLGQRQVGDAINIETDILARLVVSRLEQVQDGGGHFREGVTWGKLAEGGWLS